jgi:hypothetical protein
MEHEKRASPALVRSGWGLEPWLKRMPSVEAVRPTHCPRCEAAGQPIGLPVGMHGHGVRSRQVRGPASPQAPALLREVKVRRYRCRACGSTCTVAPWEVVTRRLYAVTAVVWALALWAVMGLGLGVVRQRVNPWATVGESTARRWRTVRHWLSAVQQGRLLSQVRPWAPGLSARQAAAHVVHVVAGYALPCAAAPPYYVLAFWGAARAA